MSVSRMLAVSALAAILLATGCSNGSTSSTSNKTLVVGVSFEIASLDGAQADGATAYYVVLPSLYSTLVSVDEKDPKKFDPYIAASYTVNPDGTGATFHLRHDVRFSDGTPLTSADVVFTYSRLVNIHATVPWLGTLTKFSAPDQYTVVVGSDTPDLGLLYQVSSPATGILNSKVVMAHGGTAALGADKTDTAQSFLDNNSAGSGAYVIDSIQAQSQIVLKPNTYYWGAKPAYSRVVIRNEPANTQLLDVQGGEKQPDVSLSLSPQQASTLDKTQIHVLTHPGAEVFAIGLSNKPSISSVTSIADIRQAIRYGIDYKALLNIAGLGAAQAPGLIGIGLPGGLPADQVIARDVAKAKGFVTQSGLVNPTIQFDFPSDQTPYGISFASLAQVIQANLGEIGITVQLLPNTSALVATKWIQGKSQMVMRTYLGNSYDPSSAINLSSNGVGGKFMGWNRGYDPAVDSLIDQIAKATTFDQVSALWVQEQAAQNEDAIYIPLLHGGLVGVATKSVGGLNLGVFGEVRLWELT